MVHVVDAGPLQAQRAVRNDPPVLSVRGLTKRIGRRTIVEDLSFDVYAGEVFGFLGPNGAGKTTTIRMLVDLIRPTSGTVTICGKDVHRNHREALALVGSIVENPEMYPFLTGWENLEHFAALLPNVTPERIAEVTEIVGLANRIHDKVKNYSLGMRQRLGIAQALLGKPKLLILDEPTNGLDPQGIKELRLFIRDLAARGMSLFISSHLLGEVQLMCDRVAIINKGKTVAVGKVEELMGRMRPTVRWTVEPLGAARELLAAHGFPIVAVEQADPAAARTDVDIAADPAAARAGGAVASGDRVKGVVVAEMAADRVPEGARRLMEAGIRIYAIEPESPSLESLYLRLTEGEVID